MLAAVSVPALGAALSRARVDAAARELAGAMARARGEAIAARRSTGFRVARPDGRYVFAFYADGDGDGIRSDDIVSGRDPLLAAPRDLPSRYGGIDFGLLEVAIPEPPPGTGTLAPGSDPVRFGRSDIVSFSPRGTSSSGTLFVSDGRSTVVAVVLYGGTGRIRIWRFERGRWSWTR
jgi:hypothetical protein